MANLFRRFLDILQALVRPKSPVVGRAAARKFGTEYEGSFPEKTSTTLQPLFFADSFKQAAASAMNQSKCLLVYIHAWHHHDTEDFASQVLNSDHFERFTRSRFILWGADVHGADGVALSDALEATRFPFLAVIVCHSNGEQVIDRIQGCSVLESVITRLSRTLEAQREMLENMRQQQQLRREAARLRNEQDRDYEAALEFDRKRDAEQRAQKAVQDAELADRDARKLEREASLERKQECLGDEPPNSPQCARLRIQLPNGVKVDRRFNLSDPIYRVYDFVDVYLANHNVDIKSYLLASNYPRELFKGDQACAKTIAQARLAGRVRDYDRMYESTKRRTMQVLYVQDLDA